eukprot:IDg1615t1
MTVDDFLLIEHLLNIKSSLNIKMSQTDAIRSALSLLIKAESVDKKATENEGDGDVIISFPLRASLLAVVAANSTYNLCGRYLMLTDKTPKQAKKHFAMAAGDPEF